MCGRSLLWLWSDRRRPPCLKSREIEFPGAGGAIWRLASTCRQARAPLPSSPIASTCGKDIFAARIAGGLAARGIAVLRFDFTGIGSSDGEFANTNFSSNIGDLVAAANYLRQYHAAPALLIGHSLGGSAVLAAAPQVPEATGVVTIGAPSSAARVARNFAADLTQIAKKARRKSRWPAAPSPSPSNSSTISPGGISSMASRI